MADRTPAPRKRAAPTVAVDAQGRNIFCMAYRITLRHEVDGLAKKNEFVNAVNEAEGARVYHNDELSRMFSYKVEAGYADPLKDLVDEETRVESAVFEEYTGTEPLTLPALDYGL
ncbi:hypothetical protein J4E90_007605 [Alternaria incomplexa]|uniref:uncharacterized protein n=1 Tax=Alternaria incomplexa TaxID=1187928 RepID=UPI00221EFF96|nr:uncharacterized protein J4E90_007605 [Alternaria incomplexa]XP_051304130.1 uncharacterized protein J4E86_003957 [Alternaria arbusti]KAI4910174.1 hypothetical protein J4E90_007605 [Alternaria incomplexa]KAI4958357.1 hypothetical protein J4E86_003957 [Alternaria arbusti]